MNFINTDIKRAFDQFFHASSYYELVGFRFIVYSELHVTIPLHGIFIVQFMELFDE